MGELLKVAVVTRGRTGSSAITEELGDAPGATCEQEVFSLGRTDAYHFPAFEAWRAEQGGDPSDEAGQAERYLDALEADAAARGCEVLFWKLLSPHFEERPYLAELVARRGYRAIYLRRGAARQVLSGLVARHRGLYNSYEKPEASAEAISVSIDEFKLLVGSERHQVGRDLALLYRLKVPNLEVEYETYAADRAGFFEPIWRFLDRPSVLPPPSRFQIMIDDLERTVANIDEVRAAAAEFGERL